MRYGQNSQNQCFPHISVNSQLFCIIQGVILKRIHRGIRLYTKDRLQPVFFGFFLCQDWVRPWPWPVSTLCNCNQRSGLFRSSPVQLRSFTSPSDRTWQHYVFHITRTTRSRVISHCYPVTMLFLVSMPGPGMLTKNNNIHLLQEHWRCPKRQVSCLGTRA